ncbi:MAG TPA: ABC transporter permease, partial [Symbiobacteriaceae bacterium]|nr:ABC transporter permease [Symbiobacteriaceae bacterium]
MLKRYGPAAGLLAGMVLAWEAACRWLQIPPYILPAPTRVAQALWQWREPLLLQHLPVTLKEAASGLIISVMLGVLFAAAMHLSPPVGRALYPLIVASQT